jgi:hypothetical protein
MKDFWANLKFKYKLSECLILNSNLIFPIEKMERTGLTLSKDRAGTLHDLELSIDFQAHPSTVTSSQQPGLLSSLWSLTRLSHKLRMDLRNESQIDTSW